MATKEATKDVVKYKGADLISSSKYKPYRDILTALLDSEKMYSIEDVEKAINKFNTTKA